MGRGLPVRRRNFRGRVAVVTGAGSGVGRALSLQLAAEGARVAISDVDPAGLAQTDDLISALSARARSDRLDVTDRAGMLGYADSVAAEFGVVNLLINNAGVIHGGAVLGMSFADIKRVMGIDFWGVVNGPKAFLPHLIASGRGTLVNISSLLGLVPMPSQSARAAAKYAVRGFTESLRMEMLVAKLPVDVTCVHPGGVKAAIARDGSLNAGAGSADRSDLFEKKLARTSAGRGC